MAAPNDAPDWAAIARSPAFVELRRAKLRFVVPAMISFIAYYFALPILVGTAPAFMATPVFGPVNLAYLFALSQFFMAWTIAALYVRTSHRWDLLAERIRAGWGS